MLSLYSGGTDFGENKLRCSKFRLKVEFLHQNCPQGGTKTLQIYIKMQRGYKDRRKRVRCLYWRSSVDVVGRNREERHRDKETETHRHKQRETERKERETETERKTER